MPKIQNEYVISAILFPLKLFSPFTVSKKFSTIYVSGFELTAFFYKKKMHIDTHIICFEQTLNFISAICDCIFLL